MLERESSQTQERDDARIDRRCCAGVDDRDRGVAVRCGVVRVHGFWRAPG